MILGSFQSRRMTLLMILILLLSVVVSGTNGSIGEIEQQNRKPSPQQSSTLKTIQSEDGDIIDCVNIYKQPALNHPMLKNHKIQMKPSFYKGEMDKNVLPKSLPLKQIWQKSGSCRVGTIPIRRNREEGISKVSPFSTYGGQASGVGQQELTMANCSHGAPYYGAKSQFNYWSVLVEPNEFSVNFMSIENGNRTNYAVVGWGVWPTMFGDDQTRLFNFWTNDAGISANGCYNLKCSGFVQVNNKVVLGGTLTPVSSYGGSQYAFDASITKDDLQSSWWLEAFGEMIGYWPLSIFTDLEVSSLVLWGGAIYNTQNIGQPTKTQLGSGHVASEGYGKAAFIDKVQVMGTSQQFVTPPDIGYLATNPDCYSISWPAASSDPGASFYYGGPLGGGCA